MELCPAKMENCSAIGRGKFGLSNHPALRRAILYSVWALLLLNLLQFPTETLSLVHDNSSHATFDYYAAHHFQFGKQVYQNVGPYGYVHYAATYSGLLHYRKLVLKNVCRLVLLLLIIWTARRLPHPALRCWWWASFFVFFPLGITQSFDLEQPLSYLPIYLASLYLLQDRGDWGFRIISAGLLFYLAFLALTKHTAFVLSAFSVGAITAQKLLGSVARWTNPPARRWRGLLGAVLPPVVFSLFLCLHWAIAGQMLANLPSFVRGIFLFSSGYNEAMLLPEEISILPAGILMMAILLTRSLHHWIWGRHPAARVLIEGLFLYLIWKHGFVRADGEHEVAFLESLLLLATPWVFATVNPTLDAEAVVPAANAKPPAPRSHGGLWARLAKAVDVVRQGRPTWLRRLSTPLALGIALVLVIIIGSSSFFGPRSPWFKNSPTNYHPSRLIEHLRYNAAWLLWPRQQRALLDRELIRQRQVADLPLIRERVKNATVDVFGYLPGFALLNGMNYWPRPMPISFAASNAGLQEANESFYRDPARAPEFVLCAVLTIDHRALFQNDALALRALLDNYHPVQMEKDLLLLQKNPPPMRPRSPPQLLGESTLKFRQFLQLDRYEKEMIWMEAQFKLTMLGSCGASSTSRRTAYMFAGIWGPRTMCLAVILPSSVPWVP